MRTLLILGLSICYCVKSTEGNRIAGVVTSGHECAEIGSSMFLLGGNAVDAAVAAMICEGVAMPHSTGIGGGFLMTIYDRETRSVYSINARERAPFRAREDMFVGNADLAKKGGLSVAVPGELRGYEIALHRHGRLNLAQVMEPTIKLCEEGHYVTEYLEKFFERNIETLRDNPSLGEIFINQETNNPYKKGDVIKRPKLAETLRKIAQQGADVLYEGDLTSEFIKDIDLMGGIIDKEDLSKYRVEESFPIITELPKKQILYSSPFPGSGAILGYILSILRDTLDTKNIDSSKNWHKIVESFKHGYSKRSQFGQKINLNTLVSQMTSPDYIAQIRDKISMRAEDIQHYNDDGLFHTPTNHGTAHISVIDEDGNAVSVTSTINGYFGAQFVSPSTGIILNNQMDDFSSPDIVNSYGIEASPNNYIVGGNQPLSSMCPSIIVNKHGDVVLAVGAAGGSKITTSVALVIIRHLWFGETLKKAIMAPRLHHQMFPIEIDFEKKFDERIKKKLSKKDHLISTSEKPSGFAAVTGLSKHGNQISGSSDPRRKGKVAYVKNKNCNIM